MSFQQRGATHPSPSRVATGGSHAWLGQEDRRLRHPRHVRAAARANPPGRAGRQACRRCRHPSRGRSHAGGPQGHGCRRPARRTGRTQRCNLRGAACADRLGHACGFRPAEGGRRHGIAGRSSHASHRFRASWPRRAPWPSVPGSAAIGPARASTARPWPLLGIGAAMLTAMVPVALHQWTGTLPGAWPLVATAAVGVGALAAAALWCPPIATASPALVEARRWWAAPRLLPATS